MEHKKMLMKLLEDYQPFMYNHYVQDDVKNYAYLEKVADAILNLNKAFVSGQLATADVCSCSKPWGVTGRCVACEKPIG